MTQQAQNYNDNSPELIRDGSLEVPEIMWLRYSVLGEAVSSIANSFIQRYGEYKPLEQILEVAVDVDKTVSLKAKPIPRDEVELESPANHHPDEILTSLELTEKQDKQRRLEQAKRDLEQINV